MASKNIKKSKIGLKKFLLSEEGRVNKKKILKAGLGLLMLGVAAGRGLAQHQNYIQNVGNYGEHVSYTHASHGSHASHASHASHGSHASHASHASHGSHASHASHGSHSSY
jgi:hypothetical protein